MARKQKHRPVGAMLLDTFFGTSLRAAITGIVILILFTMFFPDRVAIGFNNVISVIVETLGPAVGPLLSIALVIWAILFILKKSPR